MARLTPIFKIMLVQAAAAMLCVSGFTAFAHADQRVVSIGGDLTEIIYALGKEGSLVATDTTSVYPAAALATPKVGYVRQLSAEGVLSVEPDTILISGAAGPPQALEQLRAAGITLVELPTEYTIEAIFEKIDVVSTTLGADEKGTALKAKVVRDWAQAQSAISALPRDLSALFFTTLNDGAPRAAGTQTAAHGLIDLLSARNVFADRTGYKGISLEAAVAADPDIIMVMDRYAQSAGGVSAIKNHPAISLTTAAKKDRIILV
ncbi:MAG: ABC transporter substrate-binding protein, partial [Pseudomonadota bacterium]